MPFLKTSEECLLGIKKFDGNHMREVAIVNLLYEAIRSGLPEHDVQGLVHGLLRQTHRRFTEEGDLMRHMGYPGYRQHRTDHHRITRALARKWATVDLSDGANADVALATLQYGAELMRHHMMTEDAAVAAFLAERAEVKEASDVGSP